MLSRRVVKLFTRDRSNVFRKAVSCCSCTLLLTNAKQSKQTNMPKQKTLIFVFNFRLQKFINQVKSCCVIKNKKICSKHWWAVTRYFCN